jgi:magnesium-transporting ATPase (P-type)
MVAFTAFNVFLLGYSIIQLMQHLETWSTIMALDPNAQFIPANVDNRYLQMSVVCVLGLCSLAFVALTWELYREFGWTVFKKLGANMVVRRMYKNHLTLLTLLKLDGFFFISYSAQMSTLAIWKQSASYYISSTWLHVALGIPLSLVTLLIGLFAACLYC